MNSSISEPRHVPPAAPGTLAATGGLGQVDAQLGRRDRQRRRRALRRPSLDHPRLHADGGEPHRAADRHELQRHRTRRRHLLLPGHRGGRRRQRRPARQRGVGDRRRPTRPPPSIPSGLAAAPAAGQAALTWRRLHRRRRNRALRRPPVARRPASSPRSANRIGAADRVRRYSDIGHSRRAPTTTR